MNILKSWTSASIAKNHLLCCWGEFQLAQMLGNNSALRSKVEFMHILWLSNSHLRDWVLEKSSQQKQQIRSQSLYVTWQMKESEKPRVNYPRDRGADRTQTAKRRTGHLKTAMEKQEKGNALERRRHHVAWQQAERKSTQKWFVFSSLSSTGTWALKWGLFTNIFK